MTDEELLRKYHELGDDDKGRVDNMLDYCFYNYTVAGRLEEMRNGRRTTDDGRRDYI